MTTHKKCQCGAAPRFVLVRGARVNRHRRTADRERLECQACGNSTPAMHSRELLVAEWNCAGWCGQSVWKAGVTT